MVADDVITTGRTIKETTKAIKKLGGIVVGYTTLWQREEIKNLKANVYSLVTEKLESWDKNTCPLCLRGEKVTLTANKRGEEFLEKYGNDPNNWPAGTSKR